MDFTTLKVAAAIVAVVCASGLASRYLSRQRLAQRYGCQPVWRSLSKDPLLGLDTLPGTIRTLWQHKMLQRSCEYHATLGTTFTVKELTRRGILTIEPENIKTVLALNFKDYALGHRLEAFRPLLGEGIFDTDGKHWSHSRALLRPSFTRDHIADLTTLEDHFQNLLLLLPRDGKSVFDLLGPFFRYTLDSATEFLFGETTGTLRQASSTLGFAEAFHYAQKAVIVRATLGPLRFLYRDRQADKSNRICRDFARRYVDKAYQTLEDERSGHGKATSEKHVFSRELAARTSDRERVLDEVMNVLLAGRDTTASLLSNLFFMLAKHSDIWGKLRAEVAVLQGRIPNYDELQSLKYVQCCINESLRLHPVVPRNERMAVRDTVLPLGGGRDGQSPVLVTKGTLVCYNVYAMHRRKDFYGPDADEFRPERWEHENLQQLRWRYLPFNGGPRICLGQRYALTEVAYVLVRMVQEFQGLRSADPGPWEESLSLTLCPRNGVKLVLTPI